MVADSTVSAETASEGVGVRDVMFVINVQPTYSSMSVSSLNISYYRVKLTPCAVITPEDQMIYA